MADNLLQDVSAGNKVGPTLTAYKHNAWNDAARAEIARKLGGLGGGQFDSRLDPQLTVMVQNDTGGTLLPGACLALGSPIITPQDWPYRFRRRPVFNAAAAAAATDVPCILVDPIYSGRYGRATVMGVAFCEISITDTTHKWAKLIAADTAKLVSGTDGPARILWKETGSTGVQTCVILLSDGEGTAGGSVSDADCSTAGKVNTSTQTLGTGLKRLWQLQILGPDGTACGTSGPYLENYFGGLAISPVAGDAGDGGYLSVQDIECPNGGNIHAIGSSGGAGNAAIASDVQIQAGVNTAGALGIFLQYGVNADGAGYVGQGAVQADQGFIPPSLADGSALNNSIYFSSTSGKLSYKDGGGTSYALH